MNRIDQLFQAVIAERGGKAGTTRTGRLFAKGRAQIGKKLGEEAVEVIVAYMKGDREATVHESVDMLYHLAVLWAELGINPSDVWNEMDRRTAMTGLAGKLPKSRADRKALKKAA